MKKISNVEARNIIEAGFPVKALIARNYKPVKNLADLDKNLEFSILNSITSLKTQKFQPTHAKFQLLKPLN